MQPRPGVIYVYMVSNFSPSLNARLYESASSCVKHPNLTFLSICVFRRKKNVVFTCIVYEVIGMASDWLHHM